MKIDGWPWKTIGHLSYAASSYVHHFIAIGIFKLKLESGNALFGSKLGIFLSRVILKIDGWPWKTIGHLFYTISNFVHHFKSIGEVKLELQSGNDQFASKLAFLVLRDLEIWWMTLENNKTPHIYYIKFVQHFKAIGIFKLELQSGIAQFGSKLAIFCPTWPWKLTDELETQ